MITAQEKRDILLNSVHKKYVVFSVSTTSPPKTVENKELGYEIDRLKNAAPGTTKATLHLRARGDLMSEVDVIQSNCCKYLRSKGVPYGLKAMATSKTVLIPTDELREVLGVVKGYVTQMEDLLDNKIAPAYDQLVQEKIQSFGDAARGIDVQSKFPTFDAWAAKARIYYTFDKLTDASSIMNDSLMGEFADDLLKTQEQILSNSINAAMGKAITAIEAAVMSSRDGDGVKVMSATWTNGAEAVAALRSFNIFNDPKIEKLADKLSDTLRYDPQDVRADANVRKQMHRDATSTKTYVDEITKTPEADDVTEALGNLSW